MKRALVIPLLKKPNLDKEIIAAVVMHTSLVFIQLQRIKVTTLSIQYRTPDQHYQLG